MKKISFLLLLLLVVTTPVFPVEDMANSKATHQPLQFARNDLPDLPLLQTDGQKINTKELEGKVVLVLFQPDCEHCQREAVQIREHLEAFEGYTLYFITYAPMVEISRFAKDYGLNRNDNIFFAYADVQDILKSFGSVPTPSMYIYSGHKQLVKTFKGETPITKILPYI